MLKKIVKKVIRYKSPLDAYRFHIDKVDESMIAGWAHKVGEGNYAPSIEVRHNNVILYTSSANLMREDLKGAAIGSGQYGFSINTEQLKTTQDIDSIDIFVDELKINAKPLPLVLKANIKTEVSNPETTKLAKEFPNEIAFFDGAMTKELQRLTTEIEHADDNAMSVAIENIASLTVRVEIIEDILTKHFAKK